MKIAALAAVLVIAACSAVGLAQVQTIFHVSVTTSSGKQGVIDWTQGWIQAKGLAVPPANARTEAQGKLLARRGAIMDAQRTLVEILEGVRLVGSSTLLNLEPNDVVRTNVITSSLLTHAQILPGSEKWVVENGQDWRNGYYEVTLQYNIAGLIITTLPYVLQHEGKQTTEKVSPVQSSSATPQYTGLVIDARGLGITPQTFIEIIGANGEVYAATVAALYVPAANYTLSGTGKAITEAQKDPRVGSNPLVIKALGVNELKTGLIVSSKDGRLIKQLATTTDILIRGDGSVLIVAD